MLRGDLVAKGCGTERGVWVIRVGLGIDMRG